MSGYFLSFSPPSCLPCLLLSDSTTATKVELILTHHSTYDWNTQYANRSSRYGVLPCCCGENCKDTKDFVEAANLKGFQTLLYGCEQQLKGSGIEFADVDYGFGKKKGPKSLPMYWATLNTAQKAGVAIGMIIGGIVVLVLLFACLGACCG